MDVSIDELNGIQVIRLNGSLDARSANGFRDRLSGLITNGATRFVVDASQLRFVDSRGLGTLIYLRRFARQGKGDVRIAAAGREMLEVLDISGLGQVFDLAPDIATAVARFTGPAPT